MDALPFLLRCNYSVEFFTEIPTFYQDILRFLSELKRLYDTDSKSDTVSFNDKEILTWSGSSGIRAVQDLFDLESNIFVTPSFSFNS